jgi:hypothetical protein
VLRPTQVPASCGAGALIDADGNCCASGVLTATKQCCVGTTPKVDGDGNCCASGVLNACSECDGPSSAKPDLNGVCCHGKLTPAGECCPSGVLDACGLCDGTGTTCATQVQMSLPAPPTNDPLDPAYAAYYTDAASTFASSVGVSASDVQVGESRAKLFSAALHRYCLCALRCVLCVASPGCGCDVIVTTPPHGYVRQRHSDVRRRRKLIVQQ